MYPRWSTCVSPPADENSSPFTVHQRIFLVRKPNQLCQASTAKRDDALVRKHNQIVSMIERASIMYPYEVSVGYVLLYSIQTQQDQVTSMAPPRSLPPFRNLWIQFALKLIETSILNGYVSKCCGQSGPQFRSSVRLWVI